MMKSNPLTKGKLFVLFVVFIFIVTFVYLYVDLQESYENIQCSNRCLSELASVKYQLNVVTEYKNRIDKLLNKEQKTYEADKERFKDIMENCVAMKQQTAICQNQFEDLQSECKKIKEDYEILKKEMEKLKTSR